MRRFSEQVQWVPPTKRFGEKTDVLRNAKARCAAQCNKIDTLRKVKGLACCAMPKSGALRDIELAEQSERLVRKQCLI